jgi:hypothetical protein
MRELHHSLHHLRQDLAASRSSEKVVLEVAASVSEAWLCTKMDRCTTIRVSAQK